MKTLSTNELYSTQELITEDNMDYEATNNLIKAVTMVVVELAIGFSLYGIIKYVKKYRSLK